jgi:molybdopterin molybdotransferase
MLDPKQALQMILGACRPLDVVTLALAAARGRSLAHDVRALVSLPGFDVSALDGVAVNGAHLLDGAKLPLAELIAAGARPSKLRAAFAAPIATGAPVPAGADRVIPNELIDITDGFVTLKRVLTEDANIRFKGEELEKGAVVLAKGQKLSPWALGLAAGSGAAKLSVRPKPRVSALVTGSELKPAGSPLAPGQIYDSNGPLMQAWLDEQGLAVEPARVKDDAAGTKAALAAALKGSDLVLICGGVSVGTRDFVRPALQALGVKQLFWGVAQKPGKPLFVGKKGKTLVFGLPGNPAAVALCLRLYVLPALNAMQGMEPVPGRQVRAGEPIEADPTKTLFLKGRVGAGDLAWPLGSQGSHMLSSVALADAWLEVPPSRGLATGELMTVHPL